MRTHEAVMAPDLRDPEEYAAAALDSGVRAVYALPVSAAASPLGVLDLFRAKPGPLSAQDLTGSLLAAEFAALPLLGLLGGGADPDSAGDGVTSELAALERVEVYQATSMLMGQLDCGPVEALVRLRAHAFAVGMTASEVAWLIVDRQLVLDTDGGTA